MKDNQRITVTKRMLQEGLIRLLKTKPIDKVKVIELCEESGINRATFYRHYEVPKDILREIRYRIFEEAKHIAEKDHAEKNPRKWLKDLCEYFYSNADTLNILFKTRTDDEFIELLNDIYAKHVGGPGEYRIPEDADADRIKLTAYFYASGIYCVIRQWLTEPIQKTPEEIAELLYQFLE